MQPPLVYVLVINWNGLEHLEACFSSLLKTTYPNTRFLLVDNASTDGSADFVRDRFGRDNRVEILQCAANLGWSGGNNEGIRHAMAAGADYVFLINNDTATERDAISELVYMAEARTGIGALAPKMLLFDQPALINSVGLLCSIIGSSWDKGIGRLDGPEWDTPERVIGVCGGACFIRSSVLARTGLLPEDFEIYLDDLDLCLRIWEAGWEVWSCPQARVRHKFSATFGEGSRARRKYFLNTRNRFYLIARNFPGRKIVATLPHLLSGELRAVGRAALDGEYWRILAHLRAWAAAAAYLPRAFRQRRARGGPPSGHRFWPFLLRKPLFCPGLSLPVDGWYPERDIRGRRLRPISASASFHAEPGDLRLFHANCYPALHPTDVEVRAGGAILARLTTLDSDVCTVHVPGGRVELAARQLFRAEDTGELMDLGGWLAIEQSGHGLERGRDKETGRHDFV